MINPKRDALGSKETAEKVVERARRVVPAYKHYLETRGFKVGEPFDQLPQSDKNFYILAYPFQELLAEEREEIFTMSRSSGSSGHPCYWPQMKSHNRAAPTSLRTFLEGTFAVHQKKTLAIVGLALGSWLGGDVFSWALKSMAVDAPYPFWVFSPGNQHDEIIEMSGKIDFLVEQIVLFLCPSSIAHLHLKAEELNQSLPLTKFRYVVTGEPFPESVRASLQHRAGVEEDTPFMFSIYGSADTGGLGVESLGSIALRKLLERNHALARSLGVDYPIPHLFHCDAPDTYLARLYPFKGQELAPAR
ncbi:MAG: hypothetical protein JO235_13710 [Chroococcidiopsidaceae cyanobacterium CP_BM_RX_35]|nr:hypothetical protein [Chroococcidiopsidaceae cyanobacterium CP_BM_RX_35]